MRILILTTLIVLSIAGKSQELSKHELGINLAHTPYYFNSVWDENLSFAQIISPITYKYFIDSSSVIRVNTQYRTQEKNIQGGPYFDIVDASRFSVAVGYQKLFKNGKFKPTLYSDLTFVTEDFYRKKFDSWEIRTIDFTSIGAAISGGAGLRYEFHPKWALAYEADIGLYTRRKNGYEEVGSTSRTQWSNAMVTNWRVNPVSNISINFRF